MGFILGSRMGVGFLRSGFSAGIALRALGREVFAHAVGAYLSCDWARWCSFLRCAAAEKIFYLLAFFKP